MKSSAPATASVQKRGTTGVPRFVLSLCTLIAVAGLSHRAAAHNRFPTAQQVLVDPADRTHLWARTTYGLLSSPDSGASWDWICQDGVGYNGQFDPKLAITSDSRVFVGSTEGLFSSASGGCSWSKASGIDRGQISDVAVESDGQHVLALALLPAEDHYTLQLYRSDQSAEQFSGLGEPLAQDLLGRSLAVSEKHIYVTGSVISDGGSSASLPRDVLLRTTDGGLNWDRLNIPGSSLTEPASILGLDRLDADGIYVRVAGAAQAGSPVENVVLHSADAGDTWREVFRGAADVLGFVSSDDGKTVWLGLGDSHDPSGTRAVDPTAMGVYVASAPELSFSRQYDGQVGCLAQATTGLYVCGAHESDGFELGLWQDAPAAAPLFDFGQARGVLQCDGKPLLACQAHWEQDCSLLGKCPPATVVAIGADDRKVNPAAGGSDCSLSAPTPGRRSPIVAFSLLALIGAVGRRLRPRRAARRNGHRTA